MIEGVYLKDLFLGQTDGAVEARRDDFQELFFDPYSKYNQLMSGAEKFLVLGSKGTGKTYLANYVMAKAQKHEHVKLVGETEFTVSKLIAVSQEKLDNELALAFCKWFLLDRLGHLIVDSRPIRSSLLFSKTYKLRKFIQNHENDKIYRTVKQIINNTTETGKELHPKYLSAVGEVSGKVSTTKGASCSTESERKKFFELIPAFEKLVFKSIGEKDNYELIIDDLDEITDSDGLVGRDDIIINILKAAKKYNLDNANISTCKNGKCKIIILLRSDILG